MSSECDCVLPYETNNKFLSDAIFSKITWTLANTLTDRSKHASIEGTIRKSFPNESAQSLCDKLHNTFLNAAVKI